MARERWTLAIAGVAAVAFLLRWWHVAAMAGTPLDSVLVGDGRQYDQWAHRIAGGDWMGREVFFQSPLYPYLLGSLYATLTSDLHLVRLWQAAMGSAACVFLGLGTRWLVGDRAGLVAAVLLAVYPPAIFFDGLIQKASLDLFLMTLLMMMLAGFIVRPRWTWIAAAGVALGLLALNRENARVLYPVVVIWLMVAFRHVRGSTRLAWAAAFTLAMACVFAPVAWRNYRVGGELTISTSQFGTQFYIGNRHGASGTYEPLLPGRGDPDYERQDSVTIAEHAAGRPLSAGDVSDYWWGLAKADIQAHPGAWLALMGRKLLLTINAREGSDTESIDAYAVYSPVLRIFRWLTFGILLPLAVFGVWLTRADWRRFGVFHATAIVFIVSVAAFYVFARYRFPLAPVAMLFAAAAIAAVTRRPPALPHRWWMGVALAAVVAVLAYVPFPRAGDITWFSVGAELLAEGRAAEARPMLEKAIAETPDHADSHYLLGEALRSTGEFTGAVDELETAVRLRPEGVQNLRGLSAALLIVGRNDEAVARARDAVRIEQGSAAARGTLGNALARSGLLVEAVGEFAEAIRLGSTDVVIRNNLGTALQNLNRYAEAITHYEAALELKPDYTEARNNLALTYAAAGRTADAEAQFREALRLTPDNFAIHANFGDLLAELGRGDAAVEQFQIAIAQMPDSAGAAVDLLERLAEAYRVAGRWQDAVGSLQRVRDLTAAQGRKDRLPALDQKIALWKAKSGGRG